MKFYIRAIGKLKNKAILSLLDDYTSRMSGTVEIQELESNKDVPNIKQEEAALLLKNVKRDSYKIALDERGELLDSHKFANFLQNESTRGAPSFTFFIGGADGLDDSVRQAANKIISLGRITLPHMLARLILVEQLYRSEKILTNHPYDK